ncbi:hypothetical protein BEH94_10925 [Candidatus Altiarchaeales archaeon WOR_SM1_SCG]|nr:hypothetical protein BEH94_10925 [Candidatus Altiarchaeales archaeon WOR_SM1_SCG]
MNRNFFGMNLNITMIIIIINMLIFLSVHILPGLINLLALQLLLPWTFVTSMFTHYSLWHIFFNMLALFFIGQYIESILGAKRYLLTYLAGGIMGGIFFILWDVLLLGHHATAIGASGAIFGIFTALAILRPDQRIYLFPFPVPITLPVAVVVAFFFAMFIFGGIANVANSAHLGGIVAGVICGYYFRKRSGPLYEYDEYGNVYRY